LRLFYSIEASYKRHGGTEGREKRGREGGREGGRIGGKEGKAYLVLFDVKHGHHVGVSGAVAEKSQRLQLTHRPADTG
jgi:hypothetical protein